VKPLAARVASFIVERMQRAVVVVGDEHIVDQTFRNRFFAPLRAIPNPMGNCI
jgi:hypothetical protein